MINFKEGDRVIMKSDKPSLMEYNGLQGEVLSIHELHVYDMVEFEMLANMPVQVDVKFDLYPNIINTCLSEDFVKIEQDEICEHVEPPKEESSMSSWARKEIEIACARERADSGAEEDCFDYGSACYESAYKAFLSLCEDGHSGMSIQFTKNILVRLIEGKPLTPIEDIPEIWNFRHVHDGIKSYQCSRMSAFFKDIYADGTVKYHDNDRVTIIDIETGIPWSNGFITNLIHELYPITMPYYPDKHYKVYREDFLAFVENGDYDTMGLEYMIETSSGEKIELHKYYHEVNDEWVEIDREAYDRFKKMAITR